MRLTAWVALAVLALDQISKMVVVHAMGLRHVGAIDVLPPFLNFRMAWNYGVNFGLFAQHGQLTRWVLVGLAIAIAGWVVWWVRNDAGRWPRIFAGALAGGALGNAIDRLSYGAVADFLNMSCCGVDNPFAFNVADIGIFFGAIGLVLTHRGNKTP